MTGVQARCVWRVAEGASLRAALRCGSTGVELELGGTRRISEFSSAGLAVAVGLQVCVCRFISTPPEHSW